MSPERPDSKSKGKERSKGGNSVERKSLQEVSIAFGENLAKIYVVATQQKGWQECKKLISDNVDDR